MTAVSAQVARAGGAFACLLALAACGAGGGGTATHPTPTRAAPVVLDKGPECEGDKAAKGLHVLRGASARLPGGAKVAYEAAQADGTHRTAVLAVGSAEQTVSSARKVTLAGHMYTVAEVCAYRVVLTGPGLHAPARSEGEMAKWPITYDGVLPLRWHVPVNGIDVVASIVVTDVGTDPLRCTISVVEGTDEAGGTYRDLAVGSTLEFAGRLWRVKLIDPGNMNVSEASRDFAPGRVQLEELGDA